MTLTKKEIIEGLLVEYVGNAVSSAKIEEELGTKKDIGDIMGRFQKEWDEITPEFDIERECATDEEDEAMDSLVSEYAEELINFAK